MKQRNNRSKSLSLLTLMPLVGGCVLSNIESKDTPMSLTSNLGTTVRYGIKMTADKNDCESEEKTFKTSEPVDAKSTLSTPKNDDAPNRNVVHDPASDVMVNEIDTSSSLNQSESVNTETKGINQVSDEVTTEEDEFTSNLSIIWQEARTNSLPQDLKTKEVVESLKTLFLDNVHKSIDDKMTEKLKELDGEFDGDGFITPGGLEEAYRNKIESCINDMSLLIFETYLEYLDGCLQLDRKFRIAIAEHKSMVDWSVGLYEALQAEIEIEGRERPNFKVKRLVPHLDQSAAFVNPQLAQSENASTLSKMSDEQFSDYRIYVQTSLDEIKEMVSWCKRDNDSFDFYVNRAATPVKSEQDNRAPADMSRFRENENVPELMYFNFNQFWEENRLALNDKLPDNTMIHRLIFREEIRPNFFLKRNPDKPEWYQKEHIVVTDEYTEQVTNLKDKILNESVTIQAFIEAGTAPMYIGVMSNCCRDIFSVMHSFTTLVGSLDSDLLRSQSTPAPPGTDLRQPHAVSNYGAPSYGFLRQEELNEIVVPTETLPPADSTGSHWVVRKCNTDENMQQYFFPIDSCQGDSSGKKHISVILDIFSRKTKVFTNVYLLVVRETMVIINDQIPEYMLKYKKSFDFGYLQLRFIQELADCDFDLETFRQKNPNCKDSLFPVDTIKEFQCLIINETNRITSNFLVYIKELEKYKHKVKQQIESLTAEREDCNRCIPNALSETIFTPFEALPVMTVGNGIRPRKDERQLRSEIAMLEKEVATIEKAVKLIQNVESLMRILLRGVQSEQK